MRTRNEAGVSNIVSSVIVTIAVIAVFRWAGLDIIGYLSAAADWMIDTVADLIEALFGEDTARRHR